MPCYETDPGGVVLAASSELAVLLGEDVVFEFSPGPEVAGMTVAATVESPSVSVLRVTAGSQGMHLTLSLMDGRADLGRGLLCDVRHLGRQIVFKGGLLQVENRRFFFEPGARIFSRNGRLVACGVVRRLQ